MTKFLKILLIAASIGLMVAAITYLLHPRIFHSGYRYLRGRITHCGDYLQNDYSKSLNDRLASYIDTSRKIGIRECKDETELMKAVQAGELEEVTGGEYFIVDRMPYSYPYLTERAVTLLDEIGKDFKIRISETRLKKTRLIVTSMTRTTEKLILLKGKNGNVSLNSPHLNGNAFDITYVRFKSNRLFLTRCDRDYLRKALPEVIWQLRKEQRCWATYEKGQHCFHVVAR
jgi:hypothetical protein